MSLRRSVLNADMIKSGRMKKMTKRREYLEARNKEIRELRRAGLTLREIGEKFGVTRERIRQIESKTMSKLRHPSRSQLLRDYLDG